MNYNHKNVFVCSFNLNGYTSAPMAIFSNEKAAKKYVAHKNKQEKEQNLNWFYFKTPCYVEPWWIDDEPF